MVSAGIAVSHHGAHSGIGNILAVVILNFIGGVLGRGHIDLHFDVVAVCQRLRHLNTDGRYRAQVSRRRGAPGVSGG